MSSDERVDGIAGEATEHVDESTYWVADMLIAVGVAGGAKLDGTDGAPKADVMVVINAQSAWSVENWGDGVEEAEHDEKDRRKDGGNDKES